MYKTEETRQFIKDISSIIEVSFPILFPKIGVSMKGFTDEMTKDENIMKK